MLEDKIAAGNQAEEDFFQQERQNAFRQVKQTRDDEAKREMRLGYLQNHVRGQEMDFQRLHRIMGVKFTPEKPDSVDDIVKASLSHEQRNESLHHYVGVQNREIEELEELLRALEKEETELMAEMKQTDAKFAAAVTDAEQAAASAQSILSSMGAQAQTLSLLCPIVETLNNMSGAGQHVDTTLRLKGCRPDTLTDFLKNIDTAIKELSSRARALPTATGNEWLRDFLAFKEVVVHPTVTEVRKELETAAQKVKEQKEAKSMMGKEGGGGAADTDGMSSLTMQPAPAETIE